MDKLALLCRCIFEQPNITQRELAEKLELSLGSANTLVKEGISRELLIIRNGVYELLEQGRQLLNQYKVDGALVIAAGFGSRFVPLTFEMPKGLLEVYGERMIERQIKQLHEVGVTDITIVVGYLKEKFEYLIDKYQVKLLYNPEYTCKNTLATIYKAREILKGRNMYVLSSDNWMRNNIFHGYECCSWYSSIYKEGDTSEWCLSSNKKGLITGVHVGGADSWVMYGPVFFSKEFSERFLPFLESYYSLAGTEQFYWEQVFLDLVNGSVDKRISSISIGNETVFRDKAGKWPADVLPSMYVNRHSGTEIYEFENLEELRQFDKRYQNHSNNTALEVISQVFEIPESSITDIRCLKAGMTNNSFLFKVDGKRYICRIPGSGTELLVNRKEEKSVYDVVRALGITEKVIYFNGQTGYKISEYYEGCRNADASSWDDMEQCMALLRRFHGYQLKVSHIFDMKERIQFYEALCKSQDSILFEDYDLVKDHMMELLGYLGKMNRPKTLSHLDSNVDNFLFLPDGTLKLIDWEYAGMCDPLIDIAMCAIYSYYNEEQAAKLLEIYLQRKPDAREELVYYSYMALGGFLWSLWAVYKSALGEEFGEYTIIMYRYAKNCYRKIISEILRKL